MDLPSHTEFKKVIAVIGKEEDEASILKQIEDMGDIFYKAKCKEGYVILLKISENGNAIIEKCAQKQLETAQNEPNAVEMEQNPSEMQ